MLTFSCSEDGENGSPLGLIVSHDYYQASSTLKNTSKVVVIVVVVVLLAFPLQTFSLHSFPEGCMKEVPCISETFQLVCQVIIQKATMNLDISLHLTGFGQS